MEEQPRQENKIQIIVECKRGLIAEFLKGLCNAGIEYNTIIAETYPCNAEPRSVVCVIVEKNRIEDLKTMPGVLKVWDKEEEEKE